MKPTAARRLVASLIAGLSALGPCAALAPEAQAGLRTAQVEPSAIVPLDQIAPGLRESVAETIREASFHRQGEPDQFVCNPRLYLSLLNEPAITLALWKDLSDSPVRLREVAPGHFEGTDGAGATATWDFAYRSPRLHVLISQLEYVTPRGNARLQGRIVLVIRTSYQQRKTGEATIQHDVEAFVKVDNKGWKALAKTVRPLIDGVLEDQVREAGWFVSLMGKLVETYPDWARQVALSKAETSAEARKQFAEVIAQTRKPGASTGRPAVVAQAAEASGAGSTRRR